MNQKQAETFGSFFLGSSEFALPVTLMQEVVNSPKSFSRLPTAPAYLRGFYNLRGEMIPVIHLRKALGLPEQNGSEEQIAIVEARGVKVGLLADRTGDVFRVKPEEIEKSLSTSDKNLIEGVIRFESVERMAQVLCLSTLAEMAEISKSESSALSRSARKPQGQRKQCISFQLGESRCGLPIESIHEILHFPILKESALSGGNCIGMFELRGEHIPIVDVAASLGQAVTAEDDSSKRVIVMKVDDAKVGLMVRSVQSIVTYFAESVLPLPEFEGKEKSFFDGCVSREGEEDIILVQPKLLVDVPEIRQAALGHWKIYPPKSSPHHERKRISLKKSYISIRLGHLFAVRVDEVKEIKERPEIMQAPIGAPDYIEGLLSLRGKTVSVINVRKLYGVQTDEPVSSSKLLVFERNQESYALAVDAVESILNFSEEDQTPLPPVLYRDSVLGTGFSDIRLATEVEQDGEKKIVFVLDLDRVARSFLSKSKSKAA